MASIKISDLHPAGSELFMDSESFLSDLSDVELSETMGGFSPLTVTTSSGVCTKVIVSSPRCVRIVTIASRVISRITGWL